MGYKLLNVKIITGSGGHADTTPLLKAWIAKLASFDNMTLEQEVHSGSNHYARFNDNELTVYQLTFGTSRKGTTNYTHVGLNMNIFENGYNGCDMVVDEDTNNLVYCSMFKQAQKNMYSANCIDGFLFTNGGIMNPLTPIIYEMSANPAQMMDCTMGGGSYSFTSGATLQTNARETEVFISDMMCVDNNDVIHIRDHVKFISSYQKQIVKNIASKQNWINQFEHLAVKNENNGIDIFYNIGGAAWIKIDSEEEIIINADNYS